MKLDWSKFKKVHHDKNIAILKHDDGHEIKLAPKALGSVMRKQLESLPLHADIKGNPKLEESMKVPPKAPKLADGGEIDKTLQQKAEIDKRNVQHQYQSEEQEQYPTQVTDLQKQAQDVTPQHYDGGGTVQPSPKPKDDVPEPNPKIARQMQTGGTSSGIQSLDTYKKNFLEGLGLALGGEVPVKKENYKQKMAHYADGTDDVKPEDAKQQVPTVNINLNGQQPDQLPPVPAAMQQQTPNFGAQNDGPIDLQNQAGDQVNAMAPDKAQQMPAQATPTTQPGLAKTPSKTLSNTPTSSEQPQQDLYGTKALENAYGLGVGEEKAGIATEMTGEQAQAARDVAALHQQQIRQQETINNYQTHYNDIQSERKAAAEDYANSHIDPSHYWDSMSTAGKASTAIGLILGGIGGGLLHQENPALKFLNQQIDNDLRAQQANLGKKENLLSATMRQFGNERDAADFFRVLKLDQMSTDLKKSAARTQDPLAQARALQAAGQLDIQTAPIMSQIAMRQSLLGNAGAGKIAPEQVVRMVVPEHQQQEAYKELKSAQESQKAKTSILSAFDEMSNINTLGNRTTSPAQSASRLAALKKPLVAELAKATAGRFTEQDASYLDSLFPNVIDDSDSRALKRRKLNDLLEQKINYPILEAHGINTSNLGGRYNTQGQSNVPKRPPKLPQ